MEKILERLGDPGRYHALIACLFAVTWWSVCLGNVSMPFYGYTPNKTCEIGNYTSTANVRDGYANINASSWNITVSDDQCSYTIRDGSDEVKQDCEAWTYDDEGRGTSTIATEWNLVCNNYHKIALSNSIFFVGVFCGALIFGVISDHLGRKKTLGICLYFQIPISVAIALMPSYVSFTVLRFFLGVWLQGISTVAFVHCIEFFRQRYRGVVMVGFGISWAFGQVLTALLAFVFPNWRHMQIAAACLALFTVPYFWWLPESPRWLLVKGRFDEICDIFITRAARMNKLNVRETVQWSRQELELVNQQQVLAASTERKQSFINILKTPVLLRRLLAMCFLWCVSSMTYYVFILNTANLAGNRYLNFTVGAGLEIFVNLAIIFVMTRFGRKRPLLLCCFLLALFCLISGTVPKTSGGNDIAWVATVFALLGKMAIAAVMCLIFVYAAELFPTFARGSCMAMCGCSLRIGGMLAPQIVFLRNIVFPSFPFIMVAVLILICGVITIFLPETFGRAMPNSIEEAIDMEPINTNESLKAKEAILLEENQPSMSETSSNSTESEKLTVEGKVALLC